MLHVLEPSECRVYTLVMETAPTDDPLDRTVGVHTFLDQITSKALKREALLFDQIGIPNLNLLSVDELFWLQDIGVVRDVPNSPERERSHRHLLTAIVAETGEPIDVAISDERLGIEIKKRLGGSVETGRDVLHAVYSRMYSAVLRRKGINAFPILENRRQLGGVFPSGSASVLEVVLKSIPIPDDQTPWEDIIEFRNDPESMKRLRRLRMWVRKFAKDTTSTSLAEMKDEIEVLLDEYEEHAPDEDQQRCDGDAVDRRG